MAKRSLAVTVDNTPTQLILSKSEFTKNLDERISLGEELHNRPVRTQDEYDKNKEDYYSWSDYNSEFLKQAFNKENNEYKKSYDGENSVYFGVIGGTTSLVQEIQELKGDINNCLGNLKNLRHKTALLKSVNGEVEVSKTESLTLDKSQVFIVHGHDEAAKTKTARFIEKLGLKPIILHEQASGSKTVIEKIETYSNVGFGIVLYTPCDIGAKDESNPTYKKRARQNVVFEHGFLIGKIGRENVCALVKGEIETPNDISGVVYVKMDEDEAWHLKIARELRNSGYDIDMNRL